MKPRVEEPKLLIGMLILTTVLTAVILALSIERLVTTAWHQIAAV